MNRKRSLFRRGHYGSPIGIALFLLPALGTYALLMLYPSLQSFAYSMVRWQGLAPTGEFNNFAYYAKLLRDPVLPVALLNNLRAWFLFACIRLPLALALAFALSRKVRGASFFRLVYFLPNVTAAVVLALLWRMIFTTDFGLNALLRLLDLEAFIRPWLSAVNVVPWTTNIPQAWVGVGFWVVIFVAAIGGVPEELLEAARLDGAKAWQELWYVVLPSLRGVLLFSALHVTKEAFATYLYQLILTQGGPLHRSETIVSYTIYWIWGIVGSVYAPSDWGYASAWAVAIFLLSLVVSVVIWRAGRRKE